MSIEQITVPSFGEQKNTETILNTWHIKEGDSVTADDDIVELVTDKAAFNLPANVSGKVTKLCKTEGTVVRTGDVLAEIEKD